MKNKISSKLKFGKNQRGFTLFIALIVSSILLTVGFSIGNIILKQILLSTNGRESQIAFYAADSAAECALYWDRKDQTGASVIDEAFGTTTPDLPTYIKCGSGTDDAGAVQVESKNIVGNSATTTFYVDYHAVSSYGYASCAKVVVGKNDGYTTIDARGYNAAYNAGLQKCDVTNPRTVERGLFLNY